MSIYDMLLKKAEIVLILFDSIGNILDCNKYFEKMSGYELKELKSKNWFKDLVISKREKCYSGKILKDNVCPILSKNKQKLYIKWDDVNDDNKQVFGVGRIIQISNQSCDLLRESEKKFETLANNIPGIIYISRISNNQIAYVNEQIEISTGYSVEEFLSGKIHPIDLFLEDERDEINQIVKRSLRKKKSFQFIKQLITKNGDKKWVQVTGSGIFGNDQKQASLIEGFVYDVTYLKEVEDELRHSTDRYKAIVEDQTEFICRWTPDLKLTFINKIYANFLKKPSSNLIGCDFKDIILVEHYDIFQEKIKNLSYTKQVNTTEVKVSGTNKNRCRWQQWTDRAIFDEKRKLIEFQSVGRDITKQKEAEINLLESEEKFRALSENSAVGVYILENQIFRYVNPAFANMYGYESEEIIDRLRLRDLVHPMDYTMVCENVINRLNGKEKIVSYEHLGVKKNKDIFSVEIHGSVMKYLNKTAVIGTAIEITDRKRLEELMEIRRDLAIELSSIRDLDSTLKLVLDAVNKIGQIDCGAIYILNSDPEEMVLVSHQNLSDEFLQNMKSFDKNSYWYQEVIKGKSKYSDIHSTIHGSVDFINYEKLKSCAVIPIWYESKIIAAIAVASHSINKFTPNIKFSLETVAGQIGGVIVRLKAEQDLITSRETLEQTCRDKDVLLGEVHHRVKNNLQVISSLLNLQSRHVKDPKMVEVLQDSRDRVYSMAIIHEQLYQVKSLSKIDLSDYIKTLIQNLMFSYNISSTDMLIHIDVEKTSLDIIKAVPIGLIINELISNIFKHAYPNKDIKKEINISLNSNGNFELVISDNGVGFPEDIDYQNTKSFGLQLVSTLTRSLDSTIELVRGNGTTFRLLIPKCKGDFNA